MRDAIAEAVDVARDAERGCRDEVLDLLKDAKASARNLRTKADLEDVDAALDKALRRAKKACNRNVSEAIADAFDLLDDVRIDERGARAKPEAKATRYEPTMQDIENARNACAKIDRYERDTKPCIDYTAAAMRGPNRAVALQIPASCSQALGRDNFAFCLEHAAKAKRSPIEINAYCRKNHRYTKDIKDCIAEYSAGGAAPAETQPAPAVKRAMGESCKSASECSTGSCITTNGTSMCSMQCRTASDCANTGGGRMTDWVCNPVGSANYCKRWQ